MARSLWTGSLSFGLVNVPVALYSGVRDRDLHFRQLHASDGAPIETQRWCSKEDTEVPYEEIGHGFQLDDGTQVVLTDEELAAAAPERTATIEIEQFVDLDDVDPIYFDHPYLLAPAGSDDGTLRAYRLLVEVMSATERAALGRLVMRAKESLAIIRAREGALTLTTMRFADEVRSAKDVDAATQKKFAPSRAQLKAAVDIIEALGQDWEPERYKDRYRQRLQRVMARKRKGETIAAPDRERTDEAPPDLMDALERTLAELGSS